jgi:hypothetical protein
MEEREPTRGVEFLPLEMPGIESRKVVGSIRPQSTKIKESSGSERSLLSLNFNGNLISLGQAFLST